MKKITILASVMMGLAGMAHAEKNWTGFYAGVNAGAVFNEATLNSQQLGFTHPSDTCNLNADYSNFNTGVQLGYIKQFANMFVSGVEANATINANQVHNYRCSSTFTPAVSDRFAFKNQKQVSIKGRLGHALDVNQNILPYLTAGASFANVGLTYKNEGGDYYASTTTQLGWLVGAGVEWEFMPHWSLRGEYYFVDYGRVIKLEIPTVYGLDDPNGNGKVNLSSNNVAVSVNYWV